MGRPDYIMRCCLFIFKSLESHLPLLILCLQMDKLHILKVESTGKLNVSCRPFNLDNRLEIVTINCILFIILWESFCLSCGFQSLQIAPLIFMLLCNLMAKKWYQHSHEFVPSGATRAKICAHKFIYRQKKFHREPYVTYKRWITIYLARYKL